MKNIQNRNIFIDANVICDFLLNRGHRGCHAKNLEKIFDYARKRSVILHVCSYTFAIGYYRMRRDIKAPHKIALSALEKLYPKVKCITIDSAIIQQAMKSGFGDYEDAIQYCCALKIPGCEVIITRNTKDFVLSSVPVVTPQTFLRRPKTFKKSS